MEWVKCSDTMPHDNQSVLVCIDGREVWDGFTYHDESGEFVDDYCMSLVDEIITHWMPIPNPPEE